MEVRVILFGHLAKLLPSASEGGEVLVQVDGEATVKRVLDQIGVPEESRTYVTRNGVRAGMDDLVAHGDEIRVIIPLGGG